MIDVFLSRPSWVSPEFKVGLQAFMTRLADLEMNPRTLGSTDYGTKAPLDDVIRLLKQCKGAVILGYPQIIVQEGLLKGSAVNGPLLLATEWNHMEAGLAYAEGLPLLVIHHTGVSRGVFDRGAMSSFIFSKQLDSAEWCCDADIAGALRTWRDEVLGFKPTSPSARNSVYQAIESDRSRIWTVRAIGRRISEPQPLEDRYREGGPCRIEELSEYYVRLINISSGVLYTVPLGDITISHDDKEHRPMMEIRRKGL